MKFWFSILLLIGLTGASMAHAQGAKCSSVLRSYSEAASSVDPETLQIADTNGDFHEAPDLLLPFKWDYIPLFRTRHLHRRLDTMDELMMRMSYASNRGTMNDPVEIGIVELVGKSGQVLDSKIIPGTYRQVTGMATALMELLAKNKDRIGDVVTARKRHTHPQDSQLSIRDYAFSDADMRSDYQTRKIMDALGHSKIRLESWIIFMSDYNFTYVSDVKNKKISTRGYLVPRKKLIKD